MNQASASNGSATTAVVFGITEDLGGGLKFNGRWEIDPALTETSSRTAGTPATGTTSNVTSSIGNGASFVGVSGGFGEIRFGAINTTTLSANGDGNLGFGTAVGSGYRVVSFDAVRFQNSLAYNTPTFNGLSAQIIHVAKNDKQNSGSATGNSQNQQYGRDSVTEFGLSYAQGPLTVRWADLKVKQDSGYLNSGVVTRGTTGQFDLKTLSAKYSVNSQIDLAYFNQKASSTGLMKTGAAGTVNAAGNAFTAATAASAIGYDRKTTGMAATYQATPAVKLMVNRAQVTIGDETAAGTDGQKTTVTGLGLDYGMSKRTTAYVRYEKDDDKAGVRATTGYTAVTGNNNYSVTAVGIRHTF